MNKREFEEVMRSVRLLGQAHAAHIAHCRTIERITAEMKDQRKAMEAMASAILKMAELSIPMIEATIALVKLHDDLIKEMRAPMVVTPAKRSKR